MKAFSSLICYSNIIVALGAMSLYFSYSLQSNDNFPLYLLPFIFCATFLTYHLQRIFEYYVNHNLGIEFKNYYNSYPIFNAVSIILSGIVLVFFSFHLSLHNIIVLLISFTLSLFYIWIPGFRFSLRTLSFSKTICISLVWTLVCTQLNSFQLINGIECFIFIFLLCIPFDIKDKDDDIKNDIKTLALLDLKKLNYSLSFISILLSLWLGLKFSVYFSLLFFIVFNYVLYTKKTNLKLYLLLDGLIIVRLFFNP